MTRRTKKSAFLDEWICRGHSIEPHVLPRRVPGLNQVQPNGVRDAIEWQQRGQLTARSCRGIDISVVALDSHWGTWRETSAGSLTRWIKQPVTGRRKHNYSSPKESESTRLIS
jgi:hypothetical protein